MVHTKQHVREMERNGITLMDPRKACVPNISNLTLLLTHTFSPDTQRDLERVSFGTCHHKSMDSWCIDVVDKLEDNPRSEDEM